MKKIVAEVLSLPDRSFYPRIYCIGDDGAEDQAVGLTLCDAVWELRGEPIFALDKLIIDAVEGRYVPEHFDLPDFSINDKLIWVRPPFAAPGLICISNENVPEFSLDEGSPQCFSVSQYMLVASLASKFSLEIAIRGQEKLAGSKFEVDFVEI